MIWDNVHGQIELWVNHVPYKITHEQAMNLALALTAAAAGLDGDPEMAGDLF